MRAFVMTAAALALISSALAQGLPAQQGPQNAPVKGMNENNAAMPVAGANSFTEQQAVQQIQAKGYTAVSRLTKDKDGVWRGTATKAGKKTAISVDYQGNVN